MPVRDDALPVEPVLDRADHVASSPSASTTTQATACVGADTEGRRGPPAAYVGSPPRPSTSPSSTRLLPLLVATLHPVALAVVGLDEDGVLHVEVGPHTAGGAEQVGVGHVSVRGRGLDQRLPQHPRAHRVGVEDQLERARPAGLAAGRSRARGSTAVAVSWPTPDRFCRPRRMCSRQLWRMSSGRCGTDRLCRPRGPWRAAARR